MSLAFTGHRFTPVRAAISSSLQLLSLITTMSQKLGPETTLCNEKEIEEITTTQHTQLLNPSLDRSFVTPRRGLDIFSTATHLAAQHDGRKVFLATDYNRGPHRRLWFRGFSHFFPNAVGACGELASLPPGSARFDGDTSASLLASSSHCFLGLRPCVDSLQDLPEREDIIENGSSARTVYSHVLMITFVAFTAV